VRIELDPNRWPPTASFRWRTCAPPSQATNANRPKGVLDDGEPHWQRGANDQARTAADYRR
jgi:multidrug efflux pump